MKDVRFDPTDHKPVRPYAERIGTWTPGKDTTNYLKFTDGYKLDHYKQYAKEDR